MTRMNDMGAKVEETKHEAQDMGQQLKDKAQQVRDAAGEKLQDLRDHASEYYQQGRDKAEQWEQSLEDYIQEAPMKSILIAAGVGFLVGMIWKRS